MTIQDLEVQKRFERNLTLMQDMRPKDQIPLYAWLEVHDYFQVMEGDSSPRTKEALEYVLAPELRPALRSIFQSIPRSKNPVTNKYRDQLSKSAGEQF